MSHFRTHVLACEGSRWQFIEKAVGVQSFREDREAETEFLTISYWESIELYTLFWVVGKPTASSCYNQPGTQRAA